MLKEIRNKIRRRQYEFSKHAVDQSIIRDISVAEMEEAISGRCEIIGKTFGSGLQYSNFGARRYRAFIMNFSNLLPLVLG